MKAIETRYAGHLFRSRLEARWAVFFDALGIEWLYEHEGYETPGGWYLPDFWLPRHNLIVEVKPYPILGVAHSALVGAVVWDVFVVGAIPRDGPDLRFQEPPVGVRASTGCDEDGACWVRCDRCGTVDVGCGASLWNVRCGCLDPGGTRESRANDPIVLDAYRSARTARFEHGHSGAVRS